MGNLYSSFEDSTGGQSFRPDFSADNRARAQSRAFPLPPRFCVRASAAERKARWRHCRRAKTCFCGPRLWGNTFFGLFFFPLFFFVAPSVRQEVRILIKFMPRTRSIDELIIAHRVIKILKVRSAVLFPGLFFMNWRQSGDTKLINRYHPVRDFGSIRRDYLDFFFLSIFFLFLRSPFVLITSVSNPSWIFHYSVALNFTSVQFLFARFITSFVTALIYFIFVCLFILFSSWERRILRLNF